MLLTQLDKYKDPETSSYDQTSFSNARKKGGKIGRNSYKKLHHQSNVDCKQTDVGLFIVWFLKILKITLYWCYPSVFCRM